MVITHLDAQFVSSSSAVNYGACGAYASGVTLSSGVAHATTYNLDLVDCADCTEMFLP